jgi:hypothetical protein
VEWNASLEREDVFNFLSGEFHSNEHYSSDLRFDALSIQIVSARLQLFKTVSVVALANSDADIALSM